MNGLRQAALTIDLLTTMSTAITPKITNALLGFAIAQPNLLFSEVHCIALCENGHGIRVF
ncbi:hypothetical protein A0J48_009035 [Sphaerospermopsis aphanizomenoides BCCUSP55]|uniref:hypothetical protein n=1 Tax=Sphaerospermopsis aphanizomenoides TaxID=459663 RepID=UPI001906352A|nr:hypothetical protein [Sphaerospermopsis aphanizomenoides]MBK1987677.1 hypothetical protein [Sphaerospermopsis aphanizomenoides BCCUSP55]